MKKINKKWTTLMLAGALCAATLGGAAIASPVVSSAEEMKYALSDVFSTKSTTLGAKDGVTTFNFEDDGSVTMKRDLAFKWFAGKNDARYFSVKFAFEEINFKSVSFVVESESAWATKDEKATNTVTFTNNEGVVSVAVNDGEATATTIAAMQDVTLSLANGETDGEFGVTLKIADGEAQTIGKFENVGSNYAEYTYNEMHPLVIKADVAEGENVADVSSVVYLKNINGQSFDNATLKSEGSTEYVVTDNAAPVLVVNESVSGFLLGTQFALNYEKIDVLQTSNFTDTKTYYQYNPTDTEQKYDTLTTAVYFLDTVYEKDGVNTSVYREDGREYVSIKIELGDKVFCEAQNEAGDNEFAKVTYDLSWYADIDALATVEGTDYIIADRNEEGAAYTHLVLDNENKKNTVINKEAYDASVEAYQALLDEAADGVYAGSNSYIYFPSVKWLLDDNNGYRSLKFTISYKKPSSTSSASSSSLSYNGLKLAVSEEGLYEFKIFANDKAGNTMKYYLDGELVEVTSSNIWDIEEIPSFVFEIDNLGLKMKDESSTTASKRTDTEDLGEKYTLSDIGVVGASSVRENYALYKLDESKASALGLTEKILADITYKEIREKMESRLATDVKDDNYLDFYLTVYSELLAQDLGGAASAAKVKACFVEIKEYDDRITEDNAPAQWEAYNKYQWSVSSQSFIAEEEGIYVILADYWENELPVQRAAAYQLVVVDSEVDTVVGETLSWIKENKLSAILFGLAGLMLIAIIVLLFIKPSDETLEDVDAKAEKKAAKKAKKEKKND